MRDERGAQPALWAASQHMAERGCTQRREITQIAEKLLAGQVVPRDHKEHPMTLLPVHSGAGEAFAETLLNARKFPERLLEPPVFPSPRTDT